MRLCSWECAALHDDACVMGVMRMVRIVRACVCACSGLCTLGVGYRVSRVACRVSRVACHVVACCVLRVACCVLRVACCVLRVACCVLRVTCYVVIRTEREWHRSMY
jgi:hypothetical protein